MAEVSAIMSAYMTLLERSTGNGGLGVSVISGYPATGRLTPVLPIGAMLFDTHGYAANAQQPRMSLGRVQPAGIEIVARLWLYANNEKELWGLVDKLAALKVSLASVTVGDETLVVRYADTLRGDPPADGQVLDYSIVTEVRFRLN